MQLCDMQLSGIDVIENDMEIPFRQQQANSTHTHRRTHARTHTHTHDQNRVKIYFLTRKHCLCFAG